MVDTTSDLLGLQDDSDPVSTSYTEDLLGLGKERSVIEKEERNPEDGSICDESSDKDSETSNDPLEQMPPGFAFPVTKQIMFMLNRWSSSNGMLNEEEKREPQVEPPLKREPQVESPLKPITQAVENKIEPEAPKETLKPEPELRKNEAQKQKPHYTILLEKLRHPSALEILSQIKRFVIKFARESRENESNSTKTNWGDAEAIRGQQYTEKSNKISAFLRIIEKTMRNHPMWKGEGEQEWQNTLEGLEKFVMMKLYSHTFQSADQDAAIDARLSEKIKKLSFLRPGHLDVKRCAPDQLQRWKRAGGELLKINKFKSPRDKIVCILNCCRLITYLLAEKGVVDESGNPLPQVGADELVPSLIYIVLKTNPENLHSNLEYIGAFRSASRMRGEAGYFFTQLAGAVTFIQGLDASGLSISTVDFEHGLASTEKRLEAEPDFSFGWLGLQDVPIQIGPIEETKIERQASEEEKEQMPGLLKDQEALLPNDLTKREMLERFRFADRSADEIKVSEVAQLLEEYKVLVRACSKMMKK